jgi:alpha-mannosidase
MPKPRSPELIFKCMSPELRKRLLAQSASSSQGAAVWIERLALQIEFARAFTALNPDREAEWSHLIDLAERKAEDLTPEGIEQGVAWIEKGLQPLGEAAKQYTIHNIGHGHIDMNWMWSWPETVATTRDTFASVLSFMRQYPQFTYSQSQVAVYELIKRYDPPMFEEIRARVSEGRWEITAMHWVEGDKNIVHGESLARHLLLSRRWIEREFGLKPEDVPVDWEPDTFGHANTIPNFLAQGAGKYYYCCRTGGGFEHPMVGEPRPPVFWWKGTDGSRVLVFKETTWYNSEVNIGRNIALPMASFCLENGLKDWMNVYGVGNHGGGPTRAEIEHYHAMQDWPIYPKVIFGTAKAYFEKIDADIASRSLNIPEIDHELNFEFTGCYTSQSLIKQANRYGERYCLDAEAMLAICPSRFSLEKGEGAGGEDSGTANRQPPTANPLLQTAWTHVLFNQFHDILPGSGVRETREHALALFQEVGAITGMIKRRAGEAIAASLNTAALLPETPEGEAERALLKHGKANAPYVAGAGIRAGQTGHSQGSSGGRRFRPFVVWNPCSWERTELVKVDLYDMDLDPERIVARDENGLQWPTVFLEKGDDWAHERVTVLFPATVPAMGYRTFLFCQGDVTVEVPRVEALSETQFRAAGLEFSLNRFSSGFSNICTIDREREFASDRCFGDWNLITERARGMTAWALGGAEGEATVPAISYKTVGLHRNPATSLVTGGPAAVEVHRELVVPEMRSRATIRTRIQSLAPALECQADLDWREIGDPERGIPGLEIEWPLSGRPKTLLCETPFGVVARQSKNDDVPTLRFVHWGGTLSQSCDDDDDEPLNHERPWYWGGYTVLQDCKNAFRAGEYVHTLRLVRSSFDPDHAPEVAKTSFRYGIHFHTESPTNAELVRLGTAFNHPFIVFPANLQEGNGPLSKSFAETKTPNVVLTALKLAEDGDGLILRLVEYGGHDTQAEIELHPELLAGRTRAEVVDLIERPTGVQAELENGHLRVAVRGFSFTSVRIF